MFCEIHLRKACLKILQFEICGNVSPIFIIDSKKGLLMQTEPLARRMAALQTCKELHLCGELDDNLQPIGKEGFKALEADWENFELEAKDEKIVQDNLEPRPGTTKRRQYYYKRVYKTKIFI